MKIFSYLICVLKGHQAYLPVPWQNTPHVFHFCRRCGMRTRTFYSPQNWYEIDRGEKDVSPLY